MKSTYFKRTGHERYRLAKKNSTGTAVDRRKAAMERLETQLEKGTKTGKGSLDEVPLEEKDKARIKREIGILKTRT